jgi:hypothetical protein
VSYPIVRVEMNRIARRRSLREWPSRWGILSRRGGQRSPDVLLVSDVVETSRPAGAMSQFVPAQDLTSAIARDWLNAACMDAVVDDDGDIVALLDGSRVSVRLRPMEGMVLMSCMIGCDPDIEHDRESLLSAVNELMGMELSFGPTVEP